MWLDHWVLVCLVPVALWILLSGIDDLFITVVSLLPQMPSDLWPDPADLAAAPERRIAILLPLWHEHAVIGSMLDRNLAAVEYSNYDVFVGVYPNDPLTVQAVSEVSLRHPRVHLAILTHDGPTSKGDCLNCIHSAVIAYERRHSVRFEILQTHDAEDIIHPTSLRLVSWFSREYAMVQVPVLALPTPFREWTHGLYCDEFAEFQSKDIPVRQRLGGFLPSNGVGTGFERDALERLAASRGGRIFDPRCLTEDYENGFRLHALGCRQIFVPLRFAGAPPVATREYFPRNLRAAVRQRSRWVAGIVLQGWENHGWSGPPSQVYWFWRDRKGLVGNLLSPVANLMFLYGIAGWRLGREIPLWLAQIGFVSLGIAAVQIGMRVRFTARLYGAAFAAGVPLRMLWGNVVNFYATVAALRLFIGARIRRRHLPWTKTDHVYPAHSSFDRPRLGEILVRVRAVPLEALQAALASKPSNVRLGEHLLQLELVSEEKLYSALSMQAGLPLGLSEPGTERPLRLLPVAAVRRWCAVPFAIRRGQVHIATTEVPSEEMARHLGSLLSLDLRFRLVRPHEFRRLQRRYLSPLTATPNRGSRRAVPAEQT